MSPVLDDLFSRAIKNWRTTVRGVICSVLAFALFAPEHFEHHLKFVFTIARFAASGGLAIWGISAKDINSNKEPVQ